MPSVYDCITGWMILVSSPMEKKLEEFLGITEFLREKIVAYTNVQ
jgi:hypothetical protein